MIRLHIIAEGQTERRFAKEILAPQLAGFEVYVDASCVFTNRSRKELALRTGVSKYSTIRGDIQDWTKEDKSPECRYTTMLDFYGLHHDFPGFGEAEKLRDPYKKVERLEAAMASDIGDERFLPYIQLHEFEALIFADPQKLADEYIDDKKGIKQLVESVRCFRNPELIDDGPNTAPSKRILQAIPGYSKVSGGILTLQRIGLPTLRAKCPHFAAWLTELENLGATPLRNRT